MTIRTLGSLPAPAWHRPWLRYADPVDGAGGTPASEAPPADPAAPPAPPVPQPPAGGAPQPPTPPAEQVSDLPEWAQKIISDARKEAGDYRTAKNTADQQLAAILKAAGVVDDKDPAAALEARTQERDTAMQERDAVRRELAVLKAAQAVGADTSKLLDRASFTTTIQGLDVQDAAAVKAAVEAAVAADPMLKAPRAGNASTINPAGGTGEQGPITEEQLARMTPEQIAKALDEGRLAHLLG